MLSKYNRVCPICGTSFTVKPDTQKTQTCGKVCGKILSARNKTLTPERRTELFWSRVDSSGGNDACWLWTAGGQSNGYGTMWWRGKVRKASRIAYELAYGNCPDDLDVMHLCDNPPCVNPKHLRLGTHKDNMDDRDKKGRLNPQRNEQHRWCKLSNVKVEEIRQRYSAGGISQQQLGIENGIGQSQVSRIVRRTHRL